MTRVDFYLLETSTNQARENFACRLIEKVQNQGHNIFVQTQSTQLAGELDNLLWSLKPESFIPHALADSEVALNCSVVIGDVNRSVTDESIKNDVLINFDSDVPNSFSQYNRVVEIINTKDNDGLVTQGRARYKFYQDRGYKMETHNIRG